MRASIRGLCVLATLALVQAQGEAPSQVVGGDATFNHVACWAKGAAFDALAGDAFASSSMTLEKCAAFCGRWTYFGVSAGTECMSRRTTGHVYVRIIDIFTRLLRRYAEFNSGRLCGMLYAMCWKCRPTVWLE